MLWPAKAASTTSVHMLSMAKKSVKYQNSDLDALPEKVANFTKQDLIDSKNNIYFPFF